MKITAKSKDYRLQVKVKLTGNERINEQELMRFERLFLRCFLKPRIEKSNQLEYTGPMGVSLQERLKREVTKREFLFIVEHIVVAAQKLQSNGFPVYNLQMDPQYIYINETTKELQFLFVPLIEPNPGISIVDLLNSLIYTVRPAPERDIEYISRFHYFFTSMKPFNIDQVEAFVNREDRSVVNAIKKQNAGQSGFITCKQKSYYEHQAANAVGGDEPTGILQENAAGAFQDEPTGILQENAMGVFQDEPTGILQDNAVGVFQDEPTGILDNGSFEESTETELLIPDEPDDENGTMLLEPEPVPVGYPELVRVLTGEVISINKPVFRVGKEKSYVDYFVNNNNAVSRSHADLISRQDGVYVTDLNSKNHTYINNNMLTPQVETKINDGDCLKLGNEEFVFHSAPKAAPVQPKPVYTPPAPVQPEPVYAPPAPVQPEPVYTPPAAPVQPQPVYAPPAAPVQPEPVYAPPAAPVQPEPVFTPPVAPVQPEPVFTPQPEPVFTPPAAPVQSEPLFVETAPAAVPEGQNQFCPFCGKPTIPPALFCAYCGLNIE